MPTRRFEDLTIRIIVAAPSEQDGAAASHPPTLRLVEYACDPRSPYAPRATEPAEPAGGAAVLVVPLSSEEVLFVAGEEVVRIAPSGGGSLVDRAALEAVAWRRRRLMALRHRQADERLIILAEQLSRQTNRDGVFAAVMEETPRVIGGYAALVLLRAVSRAAAGPILQAVPNQRCGARLEPLPLAPFLPLSTPGLASADETRPGERFSCLAPLFDVDGARQVACVPLGERGVLALIERRQNRSFEPEDWFRFGAIAHHANAALDRLILREQTRDLSLTDALTGLGSRRKLEVVFPHHFAAARRGVPLALAWFDLWAVGTAADEALHLFGECLRAEARGSDVVVRYDDATFVALLPGATSAGAHALAARVRTRFPNATPVRFGAAEYGEATADLGRMLDEAKRRGTIEAPA